MNLNTEKSRIRKEVAIKWLAVDERKILDWIQIALTKISNLKEFLAVKTVLVYAPQPEREIDFVADLMKKFPEKIYAFPQVVNDTKIDFFVVKKYKDLIEQKFGILAPPPNSPRIKEKPTFAFIPAVACDKSENRLGRGGGFYDRYLEKQFHLYKVCVLPSFANYQKLPTEKWDQKINQTIFV